MPRDTRYPQDWSKISKQKIARAHNKCEECGIANGTIVRRRRARGRAPEIVSDAEYSALKKNFRNEQELLREEQRQRLVEEEREYLAEHLTDHILRKMAADMGFTVMLDPNERYGFHSEGHYYPYSDFADDHFFSTDSEYTHSLRLLRALGLTRINLQTNHIDTNPSNCDDSNLEVLCQFCHGPKAPKPRRAKTKSIKRH